MMRRISNFQFSIFKQLSIFAMTLLYSPSLALAAPRNFKEMVDRMFLPIIDQATKILIGVAVVIFFWNVAGSLWGEQTAEKTKKLRDTIFWGVLILFVMVSIWGILYILMVTLMRGL